MTRERGAGMKQFSIRLEQALLDGLDAQISEGFASDRMDAIRKAVRLSIVTPLDKRVMSSVAWAEYLRETRDAS
jgi:metal-responsive CopG/Arc/MetJ family transcriptional regulator